MSERGRYDTQLVLAVLFLVIFGLVMVASASQVVGRTGEVRPSLHHFYKQGVHAAIGLAAFLVFMRIPYGFYRRYAIPILAACGALLVAVLLWGTSIRGAKRWLGVGGFTFQPVELAKLGVIIFLAARIAADGERLKRFRSGFLPLAAVVVAVAGLVAMQPNFSNVVFIVILSFILLFLGGCRMAHLVSFGAVLTAAAVPLLLRAHTFSERVHSFLGKGAELERTKFQVEQSLIALGSGFLWGCGPGRGHQKFRFLPDAHTDFIYSIIGEELGVVGTIVVLLVFVFVLRRAIRAARRAPDAFGSLLAAGIGLLLFLTAALNMAMALGIIPTAGLPLPLISYGGTSIIATLVAMGILVSISGDGRDRRQATEFIAAHGARRRIYARRAEPGPEVAGG